MKQLSERSVLCKKLWIKPKKSSPEVNYKIWESERTFEVFLSVDSQIKRTKWKLANSMLCIFTVFVRNKCSVFYWASRNMSRNAKHILESTPRRNWCLYKYIKNIMLKYFKFSIVLEVQKVSSKFFEFFTGRCLFIWL